MPGACCRNQHVPLDSKALDIRKGRTEVRTWSFMVVREHQNIRHQVVRIEASHQERSAVCLELRTPQCIRLLCFCGLAWRCRTFVRQQTLALNISAHICNRRDELQCLQGK